MKLRQININELNSIFGAKCKCLMLDSSIIATAISCLGPEFCEMMCCDHLKAVAYKQGAEVKSCRNPKTLNKMMMCLDYLH